MCVCIPEPLSPNSGFGMNVTVLPCRRATFLTMYLYMHMLSAIVSRSAVLQIDLRLAGGGDFVMLRFDVDPDSRSSSASSQLRMSIN
jgi:hypothetical protein